MSPLDTWFGIAGPALFVGSIGGLLLFAAIAELIAWWKR